MSDKQQLIIFYKSSEALCSSCDYLTHMFALLLQISVDMERWFFSRERTGHAGPASCLAIILSEYRSHHIDANVEHIPATKLALMGLPQCPALGQGLWHSVL